jgi:UDP-N-acetylmuramyl pentapeptide phosphotransferase/UDP-N-acetylglucosamine-1-phosphate transferase
VRDRNIKNYPLIGGIVIIVSLLIPAAYYEFKFGTMYMYVYIWMWGLVYIDSNTGTITRFHSDALFLVPSLVCSAVICYSAIKLIISANQIDLPDVDIHKHKDMWRNMGILCIIVPFIWVGWTGAYFSEFWDFFSPGLGLFGIVIGGIIAIIGSQMRETVYYPQQSQQPQQQPITQHPSQVQMRLVKYCSKCGQQLERPANFCRICGAQQS